MRSLRAVVPIVAALAIGGCGVAPDAAAPNATAVILLDARPDAVHAGIYTAVARNFGGALGVQLQVAVPSAHTSALRALATGRAQFAILDIHDLAIARAAGHDLVGVMAVVQHPLGRLRRAAGGSHRPPQLIYRDDDYGAPPYPELVLTTTRETLQDSPALVRATVSALARGYDEVIDDPESGVSAILSLTQGLDRATLQRHLDAIDAAFPGPHFYGELDPATLRTWALWEQREGVVAKAPDVALAFDGHYVPAAADG